MISSMSAVLEKTICKPAVLPYFVEKETFPPDTMQLVYQKFAAQGILPDLFHERVLSETEFLSFIEKKALAFLLLDLESGQYAGIGWLADIEETERFKRGAAGFGFFREYWNPRVTEQFGKIALGQWFNVLGLDLIFGLTPQGNIMARRFSERLGFTYHATIPNFTCRRGRMDAAMICTLSKSDFNGSAT